MKSQMNTKNTIINEKSNEYKRMKAAVLNAK